MSLQMDPCATGVMPASTLPCQFWLSCTLVFPHHCEVVRQPGLKCSHQLEPAAAMQHQRASKGSVAMQLHIISHPASSSIIHDWIGLREILQETIDFPIKYGAFRLKFSLKPIQHHPASFHQQRWETLSKTCFSARLGLRCMTWFTDFTLLTVAWPGRSVGLRAGRVGAGNSEWGSTQFMDGGKIAMACPVLWVRWHPPGDDF